MTHHQRSQTALFAHTLSIKGKRLSRLFAMLLIGIGLLAGIASPAAAESTPARFDSAAIDRVQPTVSDAPDSDSDTGDRPNHDASTDSHTGETGSRNAPGGGLDGASYTGVNFDWSVTWDGVVWEAPADREDNSGGADYFQLGSTRKDGAPPMVVAFETTDRYDGDLGACADGAAYWVAQDEPGAISNIEEADIRLPRTPGDSTTVAYTYTYKPGKDSPVELVAVQVCLPLDANGAILQVSLVTPTATYSRARGYFEDLIAAIEIG